MTARRRPSVSLPPRVARALGAVLRWAQARSFRMLSGFQRNLDAVITAWIVVLCLAALLKLATAPNGIADGWTGATMIAPYLALAIAPVAGYRIADALLPQMPSARAPGLRLARLGTWRAASERELLRARSRAPSVFTISLTFGIVLNVPVRAFEYLAIIPAVTPGDPAWVHALVHAFTLDAVAMSSIYMACFVLASRAAPLFPRMLALAWVADAGIQLAIASYLGSRADMPADIAQPLAEILTKNVYKVAISAAIWTPYLLLSPCVNLRMRQRIRVLSRPA